MAILIWGGLLLSCMDYRVTANLPPEQGGLTESEPEPDSGGVDVGDSAPPPQECPPWAPPDRAAVDDGCVVPAEPALFDPVIEWRTDQLVTWLTDPDRDNVVSMPTAGDLDGDGVVELVFLTYRDDIDGNGTLRVIRGDGAGGELLSIDGTTCGGKQEPLTVAGGVAIGDLEPDGSLDIVAMSGNGRVLAFEADGTLKWCSDETVGSRTYPSLADLDGDGAAEVLAGPLILSAGGAQLGMGGGGRGGVSHRNRYISYGADLDGDGTPEVVAGSSLYDIRGTELARTGGADGWTAVGDLDDDPTDAELVLVAAEEGTLALYDYDGAQLRELWLLDLPGASAQRFHGGPPTVADFDGDGQAEIGIAGATLYTVYEADGSLLWSQAISDETSAITGSAVFDFEGDGAAEVIYGDEQTLWIFDGASGAVLYADTATASRTQLEYPIVADVDQDGSAEIVFAANDDHFSSAYTGLVVIGSATDAWSDARPLWNQHAYHISNINDDGSIAQPSWPTEGTFRAASAAASIRAPLPSPDLQLGAAEVCTVTCGQDEATVFLSAHNAGTAPSLETTAGWWLGDDTALRADPLPSLTPGEVAALPSLTLTSAEWTDRLSVSLDEEDGVEECEEDNNHIDLGPWPCD